MNHTQTVFILKKHEFCRELLPKSGIHSIKFYYGFTKATYRDAKMKKLEEFWRENAVGIGLYAAQNDLVEKYISQCIV